MYWYTLHAKPNAELRVAALLQQKEIETYLPKVTISRATNGATHEPLFPCYLFMRVDLQTTPPRQWKWIPGLRCMVTFGGKPVPLADHVITSIKRQVARLEAADGRTTAAFQPGDDVRITEGPMQDMLAIFSGPTKPSERVQVLLTFLGRVSRVWLDVDSLEKVTPDRKTAAGKRSRRTRGRGRPIRSQDAFSNSP